MIGLDTYTQNTAGDLVLDEGINSDIQAYEVRLTRSATLDGGVVIDNQGLCHGDRTVVIRSTVTEAQAERLASMLAADTLFTLSTHEGAYTGAIQRLVLDDGDATINFYIKEKVSA